MRNKSKNKLEKEMEINDIAYSIIAVSVNSPKKMFVLAFHDVAVPHMLYGGRLREYLCSLVQEEKKHNTSPLQPFFYILLKNLSLHGT